VNIHHFSRRAISVAFASVLILSGCHHQVVPPPVAAAAPPPPAPTARIAVNPPAIDSGQSATLSWSTNNADKVTISGLGTVGISGSRSVAPLRSTDYTVTAVGADGTSVQATARVTVNQPVAATPPAAVQGPTMTEAELFAQNVHDVYFDYDKYALRPADETTAERDAAFLKSHPGMKVLIEGHCDDRGSEEYNLALGENRAETLKEALVQDGVDASRVKVVSDGEEKPFCHEENESCWQENRRDHLRLDQAQ
jgi:peptidoglycan-associated lipoprotein